MSTISNDRNLMDIAMEDKILGNSKWPLIKHVNMCRLYTRAIFINDLSIDGVQVHKPYLDGSQRSKKQTISFPDIWRPTKNQWNVWKSFLFRNFLSPGIMINPKLENEMTPHRDPELPINEVEKMLCILDGDTSLKDMLETIPEAL